MRRVTLLIFALFFTLGVIAGSSNVWATAYDDTGAPGNLPVPPGAPCVLNQGLAGDALLGELYRADSTSEFPGVQANIVTYISIENTSSRWVAAHVRIRTGRYSIEAVDFPILLSPFDVFWFQFSSGPEVDGVPSFVSIFTTDRKTILYSGLDQYNWPGATRVWDPVTGYLELNLKTTLLDDFPSLSAAQRSRLELTQGYVEVFGLFSLAYPPLYGPKSNFFGVMAELWNDGAGASGPQNLVPPALRGFASVGLTDEYEGTRIPALDVGKDLTGHVFVGDFLTGIYTAYTMKALKDFRAGAGADFGLVDGVSVQGTAPNPIMTRDFFIRGRFNTSGYIAVNPATILYNVGGFSTGRDPAYTNPDWATSFGPTWNDGDNVIADVSAAGLTEYTKTSSFSLDEVDDAFFKDIYYSTYFNGGFSQEIYGPHAYTMAAITFPTKYLHFFFTDWVNAVGSDSVEDQRAKINPGSLCVITYAGGIVNLEELGTLDTSAFVEDNFKWEVNLLPIGLESRAVLTDFCFLTTPITEDTPFDVNGLFTDPLLKDEVFFAGQFALEVGGPYGVCGVSGDPRRTYKKETTTVVNGNTVTTTTYDPYRYAANDPDLLLSTCRGCIASSMQIWDFEFVNYPHTRTFDPSWKNPYQTGDFSGPLFPVSGGGYDGVNRTPTTFFFFGD